MKDEFMGAKSATVATADSKWDSCGYRIAIVLPQLPEGLSLIRRYSGNTLFHLEHSGEDTGNICYLQAGAPCGDRQRCAMGSLNVLIKCHLHIEIDLFWNMLSFFQKLSL